MDRKTALGDEVSGRWGRTTADVVDETRRLAVTDWLGRVVSLFMFILFAGVQCSESERRRQQDEEGRQRCRKEGDHTREGARVTAAEAS